MGAGASVQRRYINEQVNVLRSKTTYPSPAPPKFSVPDLRPKPKTFDQAKNDDSGFDWASLVASLSAARHNDEDGMTSRMESTGTVVSRTKSGKRGRDVVLTFSEIDKHAKDAPATLLDSFTELIAYLKGPINPIIYHETYMVRSLISWMCHQNVEKTKYGSPGLQSPRSLLQHVKDQTMSYATSFAVLCRNADITCVVVSGIVKAEGYDPGDFIANGAKDRWCAVHVDGSWQLLHPLWVCRGTYGKVKGNLVQIEYDETLSKEIADEIKANKRSMLNEDYFMPKPEVFIFRCFATDLKWHLIPDNITLKSRDEFMMLPFLSPMFFKFGLTLASQSSCVLHSYHGIVIVEIVSPKDHAHQISMTYELSIIEVVDPKHKLLTKSAIQGLVLHYRTNEIFTFEIRFPSTGEYMLQIKGGNGNKSYNLCKFKLVSTETFYGSPVLPVEPVDNTWGPGPTSEKAGLILPSKPSGLVYLTSSEIAFSQLPHKVPVDDVLEFSFHLVRNITKKCQFSAELIPSKQKPKFEENVKKRNSKVKFSDDIIESARSQSGTYRQSAKKITNSVECDVDYLNQLLKVKVNIQVEGEYALVITSTGTIKNVCYYLLRKTNVTDRESTANKLAKHELQTALDRGSMEEIRRCLDKCIKLKIHPTENAVAAAHAYLDYLQMKKEMVDCIKRRNVAVVNETLRKVARYRYRAALIAQVEKLVQFREELMRE